MSQPVSIVIGYGFRHVRTLRTLLLELSCDDVARGRHTYEYVVFRPTVAPVASPQLAEE